MQNSTTIDNRLWGKIARLLPRMKKRKGKAGRYPSWDWRQILEGVFWLVRTGAQWAALPDWFPPKSTVHYRFQLLVKDGFFERLVSSVAQELEEAGVLDLSECFIDGTFVAGKRGGEATGVGKRGKGSKIMAISDKNGLPIGVAVTSAASHEATLVHETIDGVFVDEKPKLLIGDGAYDSDPLDEELLEEGIVLIAPHRSNRVATPTQDGRSFRRYKRRWKIERLNSWLHGFRRIGTRYERSLASYTAFLHFACAHILLYAA